MSRDPTVFSLTDNQINELLELREQYQLSIGYDISDPVVWFRNHLSGYLSTLALAATVENHKLRFRNLSPLRIDSMRAFESYLGRQPTAEDLIQELSLFTTVPDYLAEAINRDVAQLLRN